MKNFWIYPVIALVIAAIIVGAKMYVQTKRVQYIPDGVGLTSISGPYPIWYITPSITQPLPTISNQKGMIEGDLGIEAEKTPKGLSVCAESVVYQKTFCTDKFLWNETYTYSKGYRLEVPIGKYFLYAKVPEKEYSAYYTEYVRCGLQPECKDHTPIEIEVRANQTTSKVDPQDWYNIQPSL